MTNEQRMKNLEVPRGSVDVVLDTDAYNEIDDQFAIAYLFGCKEKLNLRAILAAPFINKRVATYGEGMEKSYEEILKLLSLAGEDHPVYRGSTDYLPDEKTPVHSAAAEYLARLADEYSPERPLYVVAIGAITNVASAILLNPRMAENTVVVWLGGHARHWENALEFNLREDIAAARVVMGSGVPLVQLPCKGVVSAFSVSGPELEYWFVGKGKLADYLAKNAIAEAESYAAGRAWTRVIWDVTAVAWLMDESESLMRSKLLPTLLPSYEGQYEEMENAPLMRYVYDIRRDTLLNDMIKRIVK